MCKQKRNKLTHIQLIDRRITRQNLINQYIYHENHTINKLRSQDHRDSWNKMINLNGNNTVLSPFFYNNRSQISH